MDPAGQKARCSILSRASKKKKHARNVTFGNVMSVAKFHKSSTAVPMKSHRVRPVSRPTSEWPSRSLSPRSWLLHEKIYVADMAGFVRKMQSVQAYRRKLLSFKDFLKLIKSISCHVNGHHYKSCVQLIDAYFASHASHS